ncbi:MAG: hypothetical protein ACRYG8_35490 [Janthinobacterium lividum]
MGRKHHKPEEIVGKLRQVEVLTAQGKPVIEGVRAIGSDQPPSSGPMQMSVEHEALVLS